MDKTTYDSARAHRSTTLATYEDADVACVAAQVVNTVTYNETDARHAETVRADARDTYEKACKNFRKRADIRFLKKSK